MPIILHLSRLQTNCLNFTLDSVECVVTLILRSHVKLPYLFKLFKYVTYRYNLRGLSNGYRMDQTHSIIDNTPYIERHFI